MKLYNFNLVATGMPKINCTSLLEIGWSIDVSFDADEDNIKTFLNGLEDSSAVKSDRSDTIYVFLANYATELWYSEIRYTKLLQLSVFHTCACTGISGMLSSSSGSGHQKQMAVSGCLVPLMW